MPAPDGEALMVVYHTHVFGTSESDFWIWDISLGWLWTSPSATPFFYSAEDADFLYYFPNSSAPRWFYHYISGRWIPVPAPEAS